jgi:predicted Zn-dependent peptidase
MGPHANNQPPVYPINPGTITPLNKVILNNNVPVFIIESGTEDILRAEFVFRAGQIKERTVLLASTTNMMLTEGSENFCSEEINRLLDYYGIFLHLSVEKDTAGLIVYFLNRHIEKVLELVRQILFSPLFPEKEFSALMKKRLRWYLVSREKVQNISSERFFESIFGSSHPYGRQVCEKDFESINTDYLRDFHQKYYSPDNLTIIISGKAALNTIDTLNKYIGEIHRGKATGEESEINISGETVKKIYLPKKGALQSSVRIGSSTINKRHPDYPGLKVLNTLLGGYFGSRLMKNIREEKGYTYGIHSIITSLGVSGYKAIIAEMSNKNTQKAIDEIYREIRKLQTEPVNNQELEVVRSYMAGEMVRMFDGPFAMAESFRAIWEYDLDVDYYGRLAEKIKNISPEEIVQLANKYYNITELYEVVAG